MKAKILLIPLLLISCITLPPPPDMIDDNSSLLAIDISISYKPLPLLPVYYRTPESVYFVKLNDDDNLLTQTQIKRSNYSTGYGGIVINAEPGKYVAIAAHFNDGTKEKREDFYLFFPKDVIKLTKIEIKHGMVGYMGHIKIDQQPVFGLSNKANNFDDVQSHFYKLICPFDDDELSPALKFILSSRPRYTNGKLISYENNKDNFIKNQKKYFEKTKWYNKIINN
jgi:hypothetical protein